ncbi:MAG: 50S ribosomal protein L18 [Chlamydiales bacterium]
MERNQKKRSELRKKRALRVRKHVQGTSEKPRLSVVKTNAHVHVQLIDDEKSMTLASVSTLSKEFRKTEFNRRNKTSAKQLGVKIAELAIGKNIKRIVFDRGWFKYQGVLAAVADGAREKGLEF